MDLEKLKKIGHDCGFTHVAPLSADTIELKKEVRDMCASNACHKYNVNWCCPPGVGELSECEKKVRSYKKGILVQTVGELEDELDGETMMETNEAHKEHFEEMKKILSKEYPGMLSLGAGTCTRCKTCTYPDAPCRFPEDTFASMEAFGMLVTQVCQANDLPYYYGKCTIAYTSCFLIE